MAYEGIGRYATNGGAAVALPRMPLPAVRRTGRMLRRRAWTLVPLILAVLAAGVPTSYSVFHGTTSDGSNTLTTAASFPTVPASVTGDGAQFYHRSDDSPAFGSPTNAADSSGNTRTGQYTVPTDGASTWYRFDDGSGGTAADSSGAANPGTLVGGPTWSASHVGTGGLTFNGSNRYVTAASPAVDTGTSFTVATWAYLGARDGNHHTILSQDGTAISAFYLKYDPISDRWQFTLLDSDSTTGAEAQVFSPQAPTVNQWTHLVGVYNAAANQIGLYVNGALVATAPRTTSWSS